MLKGRDGFSNIDIDNNKISGETLTNLFHILPLRNLNLLKNVLSDQQVQPIANTLKTNTNIQQIFMSHNQLSEAALRLLAEGLACNSRLTDFFFTHNDLTLHTEASKELLKSFANKRDLKSLAINSCNLSCELLEVLKTAVEEHTKLKELYLFANKIGSDGAAHISGIIKNKSQLSCLGLSNNQLHRSGAIEIARNGLQGKTSLIKISIENNCIASEGLCELSRALLECSMLQEIYLYNNDIEDEPNKDFIRLLERQTDLFALGLEFNRIGFKGAGLILGAIVNHPKLEKLYLNQNDINA